MFGFININKPSGITSQKVISILRKITGIKQIGHAGTLDPLACGVLPVAIGKTSKLIDYLPTEKSYKAGIYLGMESDTYDIEGNVVKTGFRKIKRDEIEKALESLRGEISQIPPAFSAVHYEGKRLYELARKGKIPDNIPSRIVDIYKNEILEFDYENQVLILDIDCSKGTYIRSIVNDIGKLLGCGAVMSELIRTKSAGMKIENAVDLSEKLSANDIKNNLIVPQQIINIPQINVSENILEKIKNGNSFKNNTNEKGAVILINENKVIALAFSDAEYIYPKKVLI